MLSTTEIIVMHTSTLYTRYSICRRWGSHIALDDLVLDLCLRWPEDDLTGVETCSSRFMYIYTINKNVALD